VPLQVTLLLARVAQGLQDPPQWVTSLFVTQVPLQSWWVDAQGDGVTQPVPLHAAVASGRLAVHMAHAVPQQPTVSLGRQVLPAWWKFVLQVN
jgi:hypothetical protein